MTELYRSSVAALATDLSNPEALQFRSAAITKKTPGSQNFSSSVTTVKQEMLLTASQLSLFGLAALLVIIAPGPDNLATLGIGLSQGRKPAVGFAVGCGLGCLVHTLWAALGVTVLLKTSAIAFLIFKILGAGYLAYLGTLSLKSSGKLNVPASATTPALPMRRYILRGFFANAINPKVALFFLAFLPQFVRGDQPHPTAQLVTLGLIFAVMSGAAFSSIASFAGQIGNYLRSRPTVGARLDQLAGILFIALGIRLLLQRR